MTREEFNKADAAIVKRGEPLASRTCLRDEYILSLEQQNEELQAQIKELKEPKTCDGCEFHNDYFKGGCSTHYPCTRKSLDHFRPKQNHVH